MELEYLKASRISFYASDEIELNGYKHTFYFDFQILTMEFLGHVSDQKIWLGIQESRFCCLRRVTNMSKEIRNNNRAKMKQNNYSI